MTTPTSRSQTHMTAAIGGGAANHNNDVDDVDVVKMETTSRTTNKKRKALYTMPGIECFALGRLCLPEFCKAMLEFTVARLCASSFVP